MQAELSLTLQICCCQGCHRVIKITSVYQAFATNPHLAGIKYVGQSGKGRNFVSIEKAAELKGLIHIVSSSRNASHAYISIRTAIQMLGLFDIALRPKESIPYKPQLRKKCFCGFCQLGFAFLSPRTHDGAAFMWGAFVKMYRFRKECRSMCRDREVFSLLE